MIGIKPFAVAICLPLAFSASAGAGPIQTQIEPSTSTASQNQVPDLISIGHDIAFPDRKPRREGPAVFDHGQGGGAGGISEGIKLETLLWGGGGAIVGSFAGPVGTIVGGAVGSLVGLAVGIVMPRRQRSPKFRD